MGKLIIFEGLDGSGKGTQTKLTADHLRQRGCGPAPDHLPELREQFLGPRQNVPGRRVW